MDYYVAPSHPPGTKTYPPGTKTSLLTLLLFQSWQTLDNINLDTFLLCLIDHFLCKFHVMIIKFCEHVLRIVDKNNPDILPCILTRINIV